MSDEEPFANVSSKLQEGANGFDHFRKALKKFELRDIEISPYTHLRSPGFGFRNKMLEGVEGLKCVDHVSDRTFSVNKILCKINELDKSSDSPHETRRSCTSSNGNNGALDFMVLSPGHLLNMGYTGCKVAYADTLVH